MYLTYRYRLLPTKRQHRALDDILESQRVLYNAALEERIDAFRKTGKGRSYFEQTVALTEWRRSDVEAARLPVKLQRATLKRLDDAYKAFFRRLKGGEKAGFPRFRGAGRFKCFGFREVDGISLRGSKVRFKGIPGNLRMHIHRPLPLEGTIKTCLFRRDAKGWVVCYSVESPTSSPRKGFRAVGVDLGVTVFAALSDGNIIPSLRAARRSERKLRIAQRALSRKAGKSGGRRKAAHEVLRCHAAIARQRSNHIHQASARLIREYDLVAVELLKIRGLASGSPVSKDIRDAAWGKFISTLKYKAEKAGAVVMEVNPRNTSQDCSSCGAKVRKPWTSGATTALTVDCRSIAI